MFHFFDKYADPRVQDYFLMKSPWQLVLTLVLYFTFVLKVGPSLMKNRKSWNLTLILIIYNLLQIIANGFAFHKYLKIIPVLNFMCTPVDKSNSPTSMAVVQIHYDYTLLKFFDLLDTVFFVLRKKNSQITFLHLHHHSGMLVSTWISGKYFPGGHALFVGFLNTFVHVVMYSYYLMTAWSSEGWKNVWWKKYLTQLQIAQHAFISVTFLAQLVNPSCTYPKELSGLFLVTAVWMTAQFCQFYVKSYIKCNKL
ncbi:hypothetical protein Zmor_010225 [Zophobas morio]|uniref:Elongation of very long chain fatty acids protein n=1 Tax=Zophobas morio TaxID=2755281 RepID=A0AA38MIP7_9CUCU|nr:hypothetical protein Zmor_010225 [Zophobas morio]